MGRMVKGGSYLGKRGEKDERSIKKQSEFGNMSWRCAHRLSDTEATLYRALTARGIYKTSAVKEPSMSTSKPNREDWEKLKRSGGTW